MVIKNTSDIYVGVQLRSMKTSARNKVRQGQTWEVVLISYSQDIIELKNLSTGYRYTWKLCTEKDPFIKVFELDVPSHMNYREVPSGTKLKPKLGWRKDKIVTVDYLEKRTSTAVKFWFKEKEGSNSITCFVESQEDFDSHFEVINKPETKPTAMNYKDLKPGTRLYVKEGRIRGTTVTFNRHSHGYIHFSNGDSYSILNQMQFDEFFDVLPDASESRLKPGMNIRITEKSSFASMKCGDIYTVTKVTPSNTNENLHLTLKNMPCGSYEFRPEEFEIVEEEPVYNTPKVGQKIHHHQHPEASRLEIMEVKSFREDIVNITVRDKVYDRPCDYVTVYVVKDNVGKDARKYFHETYRIADAVIPTDPQVKQPEALSVKSLKVGMILECIKMYDGPLVESGRYLPKHYKYRIVDIAKTGRITLENTIFDTRLWVDMTQNMLDNHFVLLGEDKETKPGLTVENLMFEDVFEAQRTCHVKYGKYLQKGQTYRVKYMNTDSATGYTNLELAPTVNWEEPDLEITIENDAHLNELFKLYNNTKNNNNERQNQKSTQQINYANRSKCGKTEQSELRSDEYNGKAVVLRRTHPSVTPGERRSPVGISGKTKSATVTRGSVSDTAAYCRY